MSVSVNLKGMRQVYRRSSALLSTAVGHCNQWLFPPLCTLCDAPGEAGIDLCAGCYDDLPWNRHACLRCALPLPPQTRLPALCGGCLKRKRPPPYDHVWAPLVYNETVGWLVGQLKFHGRLSHARLLGMLMWRQLQDPLSRHIEQQPDLIIPVPLHGKRLRERGYNQALEIARPLARHSGIPLNTRSLQRRRATAQQSGLPPRERRRNLRNAFHCDTGLRGRHVVLVDDVMTTGSTLEAAATAVRRAGAEHISAWITARTPRAQ